MCTATYDFLYTAGEKTENKETGMQVYPCVYTDSVCVCVCVVIYSQK